MLTADRIKTFAPTARTDLVMALVQGWPRIRDAGINTPLRVAHFMAQIATETGGFSIFEENMSYTAARMTVVWPTRFKTVEDAAPYAKNPQKLANNVYASRMGNGPPSSGDGWRYHGRGFIQTTGREGYRKIGHEDDPEALLDPKIGLDAAIAEFVRSGCLALADMDDLNGVRKRINGGLIGIAEARRFLAKAKAIFTPMDEPAAPPRPSGPTPPSAGRPVEPPKPDPVTTKPSSPIPNVAATGGVIATIAGVSSGLHWGYILAILAAIGLAGLAFYLIKKRG